jgi:hypothetical protein
MSSKDDSLSHREKADGSAAGISDFWRQFDDAMKFHSEAVF